MRERDVEAYLVDRVEGLGGTCEKFVSPGRKNVPDRIVLLPGRVAWYYGPRVPRMLFVEVKAPGEKPTPGQLRDHARRRAMGFRVEVVDSKDRVDELVGELLR